jgi:hypothetical protein
MGRSSARSSVGYELLFGLVTRAQGLFSPRANHVAFSLEYVAENVEAPATVLHYPNRRELVRELAKGYAVVGVSFVLSRNSAVTRTGSVSWFRRRGSSRPSRRFLPSIAEGWFRASKPQAALRRTHQKG